MSYTVSKVQWEQAAPLLKNVREQVFVYEKRIPKNVEFDRKDHYACHVLACDDETKEPIGTGRILGSGEISRIAVLRRHRKEQIDKLILRSLLEIAQDMGLKEIFIYSPLDAIQYFQQFNFRTSEAVFMEAGLPKQKMTCPLHKVKPVKCYLSH
ncbi:Predicted N-acyltransferase, GNAT family [Colwellia chukchiensis]|uniref:Predicted N-acyltransferase, GNAT family n=1 Tax=Colwellia chukchiensis TaxID=641665 RepID=A0A1H7SPW7_9GAMM|nr:GNAT family N-acetyltransferase [Colwellia chukchiensis]SEL74672.1 Predicted N-acyltransferase, GNAT family [Colwellia chukchiensis]